MFCQSRIIGIGGVSRAGKSFLAKILADIYTKSGARVKILDQDDFVISEDKIPKINGHVDWECPGSMDFKLLKQSVEESRERNDITIVEGIMVFRNSDLINLFDYKIFITLLKDEFYNRKRSDLRWGREPDWYIEHIWKSYLKYGQFPEGKNPNLILDGNSLFDVNEIHKKITHSHTCSLIK